MGSDQPQNDVSSTHSNADLNKSSPQVPNQKNDKDDVEQLRADLSALRERNCDQAINTANSSSAVAQVVVACATLFITAFSVVIAVITFFGFREYRAIRQRYVESERLREQMLEHIEALETLEARTEEKLKNLSAKFEKDSQTLVEASYNFSVATAAYKQSDYRKAIEYFQKTSQLQPHNSAVLCRIGRSYTNIGETHSALLCFQNALELDPNCCEALTGLATSYRYIDPGKAIECVNKAIELDCKDSEALDYLGLLLRDRLALDAAIDAHERARLIDARPETEFYLALLYRRIQKMDMAKLRMQSAVVSLQDDKVVDRVRPIWRLVIYWGQAIMDGNRAEARRLAKEMTPLLTTERTLTAVLSHVQFLLESIGMQDQVSSYRRTLDPENLMQGEVPSNGTASHISVTSADVQIASGDHKC